MVPILFLRNASSQTRQGTASAVPPAAQIMLSSRPAERALARSAAEGSAFLCMVEALSPSCSPVLRHRPKECCAPSRRDRRVLSDSCLNDRAAHDSLQISGEYHKVGKTSRTDNPNPRLLSHGARNTIPPRKKMGPPLGTGSPGRHVSSPVSFSHRMRGVIHPSFPLRGRWERPAKDVPSKPLPPRLAPFLDRDLKRAHAVTIARKQPTSVFLCSPSSR
jgi:hypothetical protein